jgi:hypothetical protein
MSSPLHIEAFRRVMEVKIQQMHSAETLRRSLVTSAMKLERRAVLKK